VLRAADNGVLWVGNVLGRRKKTCVEN